MPSLPLAPPAREHSRLPVILAASTTVLLWASAFIAIRDAAHDFQPGSLALIRMLCGTAVLTAIALASGIRMPPQSSWPGIAVFGVGWFAAYNLLLNAAERSLDAGTAAIIINLAPMIVILIAGSVLGEGYPRSLLVGAPVAFLGVVLIGIEKSSGRADLLAVFLALGAALLYASCTLVQKKLLEKVTPTTLTWLGALLGTVALVPFSGEAVRDLAHASTSGIAWVIYLGIFPTAIAFTTWGYVLRRTSAGKTSATTYAVPATVILLSSAILGEPPTVIAVFGGVLCLLGVWITRLSLPRLPRVRRTA